MKVLMSNIRLIFLTFLFFNRCDTLNRDIHTKAYHHLLLIIRDLNSHANNFQHCRHWWIPCSEYATSAFESYNLFLFSIFIFLTSVNSKMNNQTIFPQFLMWIHLLRSSFWLIFELLFLNRCDALTNYIHTQRPTLAYHHALLIIADVSSHQ